MLVIFISVYVCMSSVVSKTNVSVNELLSTYLAKSCRTTHMMMNMRARAPMMPKRAGS